MDTWYLAMTENTRMGDFVVLFILWDPLWLRKYQRMYPIHPNHHIESPLSWGYWGWFQTWGNYHRLSWFFTKKSYNGQSIYSWGLKWPPAVPSRSASGLFPESSLCMNLIWRVNWNQHDQIWQVVVVIVSFIYFAFLHLSTCVTYICRAGVKLWPRLHLCGRHPFHERESWWGWGIWSHGRLASCHECWMRLEP